MPKFLHYYFKNSTTKCITLNFMLTFEQLGIRAELRNAITELGFETPMAIQEQVIPEILNTDNDIIGLSQTGSGKTAAYGLPILNNMDNDLQSPYLLILSPTRELCIQITRDMSAFAKYMPNIKVVSVYGGASIENQIKELKKGGNVIVATPGRLNDLLRRKNIHLGNIQTIILDEADEMLNMGFKEELDNIIQVLPTNRRTLLFSATMPLEVSKIASKYMKNSKEISIGVKNSSANTLQHHYYLVHAADRYIALKRIVDYYPSIYGIIFCRTKNETKDVAEKLMKDGYNADALHGDLSQAQREYAMQRYRHKNLQLLVATDVAARGLDVENVTHVINYNLPDDEEMYIHRSGRTGRAGKKGIAISICNLREKSKISQINKLTNKNFQHKLVPTGEEVCEKQLFNVVSRMENIEVNTEQIVDFLPVVFKKLEWMTREDIIARFLSVEFNRFLDYYKDAKDINVVDNNKQQKSKERFVSDNTKMTTIRINIGKMEQITPTKLIGLINESTHRRDIKIGKVTIQNTWCIFEIESKHAELVIHSLKNKKYQNREIVAKYADDNKPKNKDGKKSETKKRRKH